MTTTPSPKASPAPLPGLATFLDPLMPLFRRPSSQESSRAQCCTGLLTDLPRKTCDGIAGAVAGTPTERLQHLLTDADWDPAAREVLSGRPTAVPKAADGSVEALRLIKIARDTAVKFRTQAMITLKSALVTAPDALRAKLNGLTDVRLITACAGLARGGAPSTPSAASDTCCTHWPCAGSRCTGRSSCTPIISSRSPRGRRRNLQPPSASASTAPRNC